MFIGQIFLMGIAEFDIISVNIFPIDIKFLILQYFCSDFNEY